MVDPLRDIWVMITCSKYKCVFVVRDYVTPYTRKRKVTSITSITILTEIGMVMHVDLISASNNSLPICDIMQPHMHVSLSHTQPSVSSSSRFVLTLKELRN